MKRILTLQGHSVYDGSPMWRLNRWILEHPGSDLVTANAVFSDSQMTYICIVNVDERIARETWSDHDLYWIGIDKEASE